MLKLSLDEIVKATKGKLLLNNNKEVEYISTSSKDIKENTLFIPIKGEKYDGHAFLEDAYNNGCRIFLIDKNHEFYKKDISLIEVNDTLLALGSLARFYLDKFNVDLIGVTGSVGKTSTRDIIYSVLNEKYKTLKNELNYNNEIGIPKTLFNLDYSYEKAVIEMGIDKKGDISYFKTIAPLKHAVISNIGLSHIANFKNQEGIFHAKMEIAKDFNKENTLIVNGDDNFLKTLKDKKLPYNLLTYGFDEDNTIYCVSYEIVNGKINFKVNFKNKVYDYTIPSIAKHNIYNAMSAILIGNLYNLTYEEIKKGLESVSFTEGRLTIINKKDITIINDCYNASLDSIKSALNVLSTFKTRKVAILGDVLETGSYEEEIHKNIGKSIIGNTDILILVGNSIKYTYDEVIKNNFNKDNIYVFNTYEDVIKNIDNIIKKGDTILLKASHGIKLSNVVEYLDKTYEN